MARSRIKCICEECLDDLKTNGESQASSANLQLDNPGATIKQWMIVRKISDKLIFWKIETLNPNTGVYTPIGIYYCPFCGKKLPTRLK